MTPSRPLAVALGLAALLRGPAPIAPPAAAAQDAAFPGEALLETYLARQVETLAGRALAGVTDAAAWPAERDRLRGELREMLGLEPAPPREDLRATVTGILERPDLGIAVEKLHFQSVPGLYVTANFYRPLEAEGRIPAILYLCGHANVKEEGVSFGNKASYQHHPTWFARNGYACLIIDTLQLGEIEGKHHGTYRLGMWWWVARGYTPAGVEAWNSIRAVDYLCSRPEVDPQRIGVTGRSGGGIGTWWLAALDDRPAAFVPVAGITDLRNHIVDNCIDGHCDCNYTVNLYQWDYPALAALAAPRPILFTNSDKDRIFPLDGVLRVHRHLQRIYSLLGAEDRLGLCIADGPHADVQELQVPAFRWMNRWLKDDRTSPVAMVAEKLIEPRALRVFAEIPRDERNTSIEESFVARAQAPPVPATRAEFEALRAGLIRQLQRRTFRNMPPPDAPLEIEREAAVERDGALLRPYSFLSEPPFRLGLWVLSRADCPRPAAIELRILDDAGFDAWHRDLTALQDAAQGGATGAAAVALFAPRGIGPTRWSTDAKRLEQVRRRFLVLGHTLEETRVFDTRRAIRALGAIDELAGVPIRCVADGELGVVAAYAGLFEPAVAEFDLGGIPASHQDGVPLLNVLRVLDLPQALALLLPRPIRLRGVAPDAFAWTRQGAALFAPDAAAAAALFRCE